MSNNVALYRKYRPQTFADVRDQDHIVSVLEGAIKKETIPHAILFSGGRGTGKTTLARIFAKAIGVTETDIYEIDAASNRGIDDVRELREAVYTVPYESPFKVYIIDEVHMLTKEAFNALLKTLEEPPAHVVFILATTEEEKLLDTILSRCQVFRMRLPSRQVLATTVTEVANVEGFVLEKAAADLIAVAADGSFRDALGITQKVIMASGDIIGDADEVAAIIGAPKTTLLLSLVRALHEKDVDTALKLVALAVADHVDMKLFTKLLLEQLRAIILIRHMPSQAKNVFAHIGSSEEATLTELAGAAPSPINSHLILRFLTAADQLSRSPIPQLPLELAIMDVTSTT